VNIHDQALKMLEERGWWGADEGKKGGRGPGGELCLTQAYASQVSSEIKEEDRIELLTSAYVELITSLDLEMPKPIQSVSWWTRPTFYGIILVRWNDDPQRTVEEVFLGLKRASELHEGAGG
jgi:hypothetical protein